MSVIPIKYWLVFVAGVAFLLLIDLSVFHSRDRKPKLREALVESGIWILAALIFNAAFAWNYGPELGTQFLTGYLVEKSLSIDNLFLILMIFDSLKIPQEHRYRTLFFGVLGAIVMRGSLIIAGASLVQSMEWVLYVFGLVLLYSAVKFLKTSGEKVEVAESRAVKVVRRMIPIDYDAKPDRFFVVRNGGRKGTRLLVALVLIETTDLIFAFDSIPAVLAVTRDAFVAFASNILALLGLRALYFVLADWISKMKYLKPGLAAILAFIGTKMLIADFVHIPSWVSLAVIVGIITIVAVVSKMVPATRR